MELRPERPADLDAVQELHRVAFATDGDRVAALVASLRQAMAPARDLSLVAVQAGEVVGHVMFTGSLLDAPARLVQVQVLSPLVFLEGSPVYYSRFGFRPGAELHFRKPSLRIPDPAFQVYPLPAHQPWMTGTLVYAPEFWQHDAVGLRDRAADLS